MQNVICALYVENLKGYKPPKTSRISVQLADHDDHGTHFGGILGPTAAFDVEAYWKLNDAGQKLMILETAHRISMLCAEHFHWDKRPFEHAYEQVLAANFEYCIETKSKLSGNRQHTASIRLVLEEECAKVSVAFRNRDRVLVNLVEVFRTLPNPMFYAVAIKSAKWLNDQEVGMHLFHGDLLVKASLMEQAPSIELRPNRFEEEYLKGLVQDGHPVELVSPEAVIHWIQS
jgi:hypothetical protein